MKIGVLILQGAVSGAVMPAAIAFLWEAVGRGSAESRRGFALGLAFGFGPMLAVAGSVVQSALLGGKIFGFQFEGLPFPQGHITLFGLGVPVMALAALFSQLLIVPLPERDADRAPATSVVGLLVGLPLMFAALISLHAASLTEQESLRWLGYGCAAGAALALLYHFRELLGQKLLLTATIVTILVYAANPIASNMNLYSVLALGDATTDFSGEQNALRFAFKVTAGLALGWLLTRTSPRTGILATAGILIVAMAWAMFATGQWYLLAFGLFGAGELVGVYAPNYICTASRRQELRRNMAFVTMLMAPAAPTGYLYGAIVDAAKERHWSAFGLDSASFGFRLSFFVCALLIATGIAIALVCLPKHPQPERESDDPG